MRKLNFGGVVEKVHYPQAAHMYMYSDLFGKLAGVKGLYYVWQPVSASSGCFTIPQMKSRVVCQQSYMLHNLELFQVSY